jgi:hypothetical protein
MKKEMKKKEKKKMKTLKRGMIGRHNISGRNMM